MAEVISIDAHRVRLGGNQMSRIDFQRLLLEGGKLTRIAQHLALAIVAMADSKGRYEVSVRELEELTGWGRSTIARHLHELVEFFAVSFGVGTRKSVFELQGVIEEVLATGFLRPASVPPVSQSGTLAPPSVPERDAKAPSVPERDASSVPVRDTPIQPEDPHIKNVRARLSKEYYPSGNIKDSLSQGGVGDDEARARERFVAAATALKVTLGDLLIEGPGFKISMGSVEQAASLMPGITQKDARRIAEECAIDWAANGKRPDSPYAMVRAALVGHVNRAAIQETRQAKADAAGMRKPPPPKADVDRFEARLAEARRNLERGK